MEPSYGYSQVPPEQTNLFTRKILIVGIGAIIAVIVAIILLVSSGQNSISTQVQHLSARLDNLQAMLSDTNTTRNIKNQDLSNLISSFSLSLTTDTNDINTLLALHLPEKIDEKIVLAESDIATQKIIEDAYLENRLDQVYAEVLSKKIGSLRALIAEIYGLSKDTKLQQGLQNFDKHLLAISERIDAIKL